jgi:hypothetical protein
VTKHHNIIELNGKKYDAKTGHVISHAGASHQQTAPNKGHSIDGVVGGKRPKHSATTPHTAIAKTNSHSASRHEKNRTHTPKHISHHQTQKSQSLMRRAVKKPEGDKLPSLQSKTELSGRLHRAKNTPKSSRIAKFSYSQPKVHTKVASVPLAQAPDHSLATSEAKPPAKQPTHEAHKVSPAQKHFDAALSKSQSHQKKPTKKQKRGAKIAHKLGISRKVLNVSAAMFAFVLLAGFFTYQNLTSLSMQVASSRAGFNAQLPGYKPAGYAVEGPIEYEPGSVSVSFASRTDDSQLKLTQEVSNWNSQALFENYLGDNTQNYQVHEEKGKTIYLYDNGNATWVSGGVWYKIEGDNILNNEQLLRMASSLR